ncbi:protein of unknown function [Taphrina deformans PYCC 5710]|uniref:Xylanolytic transcriptional activator regulatory domain-containing protein n=1 Tax=Taphrina deformans (strain PYCC 5710 / ATCC 11124 / CBS 356.35 / IMI 108563 / JCM 9778 / NBRC 8474) TaxID=1097556 RepID=S0BE62_TAPDE|nr:protein of unknown function [Taphrina deformans PYCC 5710]|eukprot:CCG84896.1 protein of unknown function [Taphrina deformans PYCC 5710]
MDASNTIRIEHVQSDNQALQERVGKLEELVRTYASQSDAGQAIAPHQESSLYVDLAVEHPSLDGDLLGPGRLAGRSKLQEDSQRAQSRYKSLTAWDHILRELDELKLAVSDSSFDPAHSDEGANLDVLETGGPFFASPGQSFQLLYSALPPRAQMDALLTQYLNSYHPFHPIINPTKFREDYKLFLAEPKDPIMLSLLFGMMSLAIVNNQPQERQADKYVKLSLQALQLSHFTTTFNLTTVVCLINIIFFLLRERFQQTFTWILFGCTLQIARALGLHRDPSHFGITGQECQTRRHIWTALLTQDAIFAARYGRTTVIDTEEWDSKTPDHLTDEGYRATDQMPACYAHAKRVTAITIGRLFKSLFRPRARPSYQTVIDVERDIRMSHETLARRLAEAAIKTKSNYQGIQWLYTKFSPFILAYSLIVVHRPFMVRKTTEFMHSRVTCLASARTMLNIVAEMQQRGGMDHWIWHIRECSNIAYVPAATLLCVGLHIRNSPDFATLPADRDTVDPEEDHRLIQQVIQNLQPDSDAYRIIQDLYAQVCGSGIDLDQASGQMDFSVGDHNVAGPCTYPDFYDWGNIPTAKDGSWPNSLASSGSVDRGSYCAQAQNPEAVALPHLNEPPALPPASTFHAHLGEMYPNGMADHMLDGETTDHLVNNFDSSVAPYWNADHWPNR